MRKLFTLILLLTVLMSNAQFEVVTVTGDDNPEEPTIMLDYTNPARMMAGVNIKHTYYSLDTGRTWHSTGVNNSQYGIWGDPVMVCDTKGSFYYFHLSYAQNWIDRIVCQRRDSITENWNVDTYIGLNGTKAQDKHWATINRQNNEIYVTWTQFDSYGSTEPQDSSRIMFSKSIDRGLTWSDAIVISEKSGDCFDDDNTTEGAVPAIGPNGEIYVSWAGPLGIVFDKSCDYGQTWLNHDVLIDSMPGGWAYDIPGIDRCNGMPITKCDTSGGVYNGTIYVNWSDQRNGEDDTDIWLSKSTDCGDLWSEPIRVNNDQPGRHQFLTWMDVDQKTGIIYIIFYDRRNTTGNVTDVYLAISKDGGETFNNIKINNTPFIPLSSVFFGDYTNIVAYNNIVRPIWTRLDNTELTVKTALINMNDSLLGIQHIDNIKPMLQVYPNPISETGKVKFKLAERSLISLFVTDVLGGAKYYMVNNQVFEQGKYVLRFENQYNKMKSGEYFIILNINGSKQFSKPFVIK